MKFIVNRATLKREVGILLAILDPKPAVPAHGYILFEAEGGPLSLAATNGAEHLSTGLGTEVQERGSACLPARTLAEILRAVEGEEVEISASGPSARLKCGGARFKLNCAEIDAFPPTPILEKVDAAFPARELLTLISVTAFAATTVEAKYCLNGAQLRLDSTGGKMVATDGHRMALAESPEVRSEAKLSLLLPKAALVAAAKVLKSVEGEAELAATDNRIFLRAGARLLATTQMDGRYPNVAPFFAATYPRAVRLEAGPFEEAVFRAALCSEQADDTHQVAFDFKPGEVILAASDCGGGEAQESLEAAGDAGDGLTIRLDPRYLLDYLRVAGAEEVEFKFTDASSQVEFCPAGRSPTVSRYIVMPRRA